MAQFLKDEVKDKIDQGALEVFTAKGFAGASIKEIAVASGVSVGNVYRYYANKEALYSGVIEGVLSGVREILEFVASNAMYENVFQGKDMTRKGFKPLAMFIELYWREKKVFDMLLKNGKDTYYEMTVQKIIVILKAYFGRFWVDNREDGLTELELGALTNAMVFGVIDLLQNIDEDTMEEEITRFLQCLIQGYFHVRRKAVD